MKKDWKFYLGITLFTYCWLPYIFVFCILPFIDISTALSLSIASVVLISSEVAFALSALLLGEILIKSIKSKIKSLFFKAGDDETKPHKPISKTRHATGIILLTLSLILPSAICEFILYFGYLQEVGHQTLVYVLFAGDITFIVSFFILGHDFWEKFKKLAEWPQ